MSPTASSAARARLVTQHLGAEDRAIGAPAFGREVERTGARTPADPAAIEAVRAKRCPEPTGEMRAALAPVEAQAAEWCGAGAARRGGCEVDAGFGQPQRSLRRDQPDILVDFDPASRRHGVGKG